MRSGSVLSTDEARRVYDRIGALQDTQAFYEDRAVGALVRHGRFEDAERVLEFGCGTGRFAARLLSHHLPAHAHYRALDLSPEMVRLARGRLAPFGERAEVVLTDGSPPADEPTASRDRFVSNYVLDLLAEDAIAAVLCEARRILAPGGLLCLVGLSTGCGALSRGVSRLWASVHARHPALLGGCRPLELAPRLEPGAWRVRHHEKVAAFGVTSEVVVAER
jgi:SAM-dependent methyltransferase